MPAKARWPTGSWPKGRDRRAGLCRNGIRLLFAVSLPQYRIFTVAQPVKDVADVTGMKLRSTGGAQDLTFRAIGSVPVRMAAPDAYKSL